MINVATKKRICILLFLLAMLVFFTGCENKDLTKGTIDNMEYTETEEVTNYVKIVTNKDKVILLELYPDTAPITVKNFQKLVSEKFYDGLIFHRVIEDFMIQGGDPEGTGMGGSSETIKGEFKNNGVENNLKHEKGVISMARSQDMNSASSQFFICTSDNVSYLDGDYAAFGKVIAGYDVAEEISKVKTDIYDKPLQEQSIKTMRFVNINGLN